MADNRSAVSIVAILAILVLVGLVIYFVMEETDDTIEVDINSQAESDLPVLVANHEEPLPALWEPAGSPV